MKFSKFFYFLVFAIILSNDALSQTDIEKEVFGLGQISGEEIRLNEEQKKDFSDKALRKTKALSNYISTIADKSKEETQKSRAIDLAVKLFMSENSAVEISSLNKQTKRLKIRAYLNKLKLLPYYKVKISWFDIFFASNFTKRPDGKYEAIATIFQKFEGSNNDGIKYIDITKKNIQIIIEQVEIKTGDKAEKVWEVFLGDIKVEETRKE
jgi:hypothetical protein